MSKVEYGGLSSVPKVATSASAITHRSLASPVSALHHNFFTTFAATFHKRIPGEQLRSCMQLDYSAHMAEKADASKQFRRQFHVHISQINQGCSTHTAVAAGKDKKSIKAACDCSLSNQACHTYWPCCHRLQVTSSKSINYGGQLEHTGMEYPTSAWYSCKILVLRCKRSFCSGYANRDAMAAPTQPECLCVSSECFNISAE